MGLCTVQSINASPPLLLPNPKSSILIRQIPTIRTASLLSRSICLRNVLSKATTSEDSSSEASQFVDEKRDNAIVLDDVEAVDKKGFNGINPKQELPVVEQEGLPLNVLDNLNIKFDVDDTGSIVLYAGGFVVALWLTSAVIGAIDSIPLFPKLLEAVGLGYTVWFTSRYLLFKKNRDELNAKIAELKEQVLGSEDN
ncbi:putative cyanobacterial aminoacyl-tRNA synthetase, CAAD domain, protein CURVATURE THYLAKOID 1 [Lupinus albus]|uniref:Putative cyanobacterial aminoacyl-tRNA synthetase, CAAD domain, protein CURVATURE THYLAKOID 1 n=1 Tax=Lupinus albus TaxID=3870 RepID=A0A6A4P624_LUPAL|nr:putative cyanobacterial aminoacyl-tRNA synthetase, CAAD domain, protein CURVATURE THYLAKOID 1 [Lupinus albus]